MEPNQKFYPRVGKKRAKELVEWSMRERIKGILSALWQVWFMLVVNIIIMKVYLVLLQFYSIPFPFVYKIYWEHRRKYQEKEEVKGDIYGLLWLVFLIFKDWFWKIKNERSVWKWRQLPGQEGTW